MSSADISSPREQIFPYIYARIYNKSPVHIYVGRLCFLINQSVGIIQKKPEVRRRWQIWNHQGISSWFNLSN